MGARRHVHLLVGIDGGVGDCDGRAGDDSRGGWERRRVVWDARAEFQVRVRRWHELARERGKVPNTAEATPLAAKAEGMHRDAPASGAVEVIIYPALARGGAARLARHPEHVAHP